MISSERIRSAFGWHRREGACGLLQRQEARRHAGSDVKMVDLFLLTAAIRPGGRSSAALT
jgi:hypothetical protein